MHTNLFWDDLIKRVLQEIGKFGLDTATINQYRQTYTRLKPYASARNVEHYCDDLIQSFLHDIEEQHKTGAIGRSRRAHLTRASLILQEYVANGSIRWTTYTPFVLGPECRQKSAFILAPSLSQTFAGSVIDME